MSIRYSELILHPLNIAYIIRQEAFSVADFVTLQGADGEAEMAVMLSRV